MKRNIFLTLLVLAVFIAAGVSAWNVSKERLKNEKKFLLKHENISVPSLPEWMPENFVEIVLNSSGLENSSLLFDKDLSFEKELPKKLSEAFAANPWVESVESVVLRFPSGADVKLTYRTPAALVEIAPQQFLPIDKNGIVLPSDSLQKIEAAKLHSYPKVIGISSKPPEKIGSPWNDVNVTSAASLAAILADIPAVSIGKIRLDQQAGNVPAFRLFTSANTEIIWGTFAPADKTGKMHRSTEAKVEQIRTLAEQFDTLDAIPDSLRPVKLRE
ncbi:MAG: hypothetical protein FWE67_06530 [Planctomycetaceae bacterium]|nr:hypothetical protein [Planctomycetaceae bacterium]